MSYTPIMFIAVGATGAFFTLRETYMHEQWVGGPGGYMHREVRSFHHFNLSQNAQEAFDKASEVASRLGYEMKSTVESISQEMREIVRSTAEQIKERKARYEAQQKDWEDARQAEHEERLEKIQNGKFVNGPFAGKYFSEASRGYITWLINKLETFEEGSYLRLTAERVLEIVPDMQFPQANPTLHVGSEKKRMEFDVLVVASRNFLKQGFNAWSGPEVCFVTTMINKADGACLVVFSSSFNPAEESELKIKATVKEHSEYNGQAQTIVQRVTVI